MKNLEPLIHRQRLVIEAKYDRVVTREVVNDFLLLLARELKMTLHPDVPVPIITSATGKSLPIHDGYEGAIFWVESGAQIYIWSRVKFLTVDIYTCKSFDPLLAVQLTKDFFNTTEIVHKET